MKMDVKLLICDIDGTLVMKGGQPMPKTKEALQRFHDAGVMMGLASGRPIDQRMINKYHEWGLDFLPDVLIGFNGCQTWNHIDQKVEVLEKLKKEEIKEILEYMWDLGTNVITYEDGYNKVIARKMDWMLEASQKRNNSNIVIADKERLCLNDTCKLEFHYEEEMDDKVMDMARRHPSDKYVFIKTFAGTLEYMKPGIDKGRALKKICERFDISLKDVVACGDMDNDIEMIKEAGTGVCLLNGSDKTKKAADYITAKDVNHDGLGEFLLERYF